MSRVRISTTVDARRLARSRELLGVKDSELLDRALAALLEETHRERERAALLRHPYEDDPDLDWNVTDGPPLPYDGPVPAEVLALAEERRVGRG